MNCVIIDDEYPAREELKYFINNYSKINILGEFDDGVEALMFIEKNMPDIIFLDINMPKISGIEMARLLNNFSKRVDIVFITAYKEHAVEAFEIQAFDYILKPYSKERIINTLKRLERDFLSESLPYVNNKITLWKENKMVVINVKDICYCEAKERETIIYTKDNEYIMNQSISHAAEKLPDNMFFRTHRSFLINIDKVVEINPWFNNTYMLKLEGVNKEIPVSRNNINSFKHIMGI
ncbi:LytR/AlgR family response regulator transcription factor [Haloimpatiens lingqiaonensis]|uniref:LytR/AlgR family response regulator transcription factor n=1 Tax=Haloimpatiens lingqiaonensis TaxID=1380675 RepID=UPI0010FE26AF|nr:LytTR family DNA-binding domain-containing protein [Haloimpatiens lingqiaonensis]